MSRNKFNVSPVTVVIGSKVKTGPDPDWLRTHSEESAGSAPIVPLAGLPEPLKTAAVRYVGHRSLRPVQLFEGGKVVGVLTAWVNAAAKRRNGGDFKTATPHDVVLIPLFRGLPAKEYTRAKAAARRRTRLAHAAYEAAKKGALEAQANG